MSFELIEAEKGNFPKALMCRALELSRSGLHAFCTRGPFRRALEGLQLTCKSRRPSWSKGRYGAPRIEKEVRRQGRPTSRKRVAKSMARQGLAAGPKRRWRTTTDSSHKLPIAPNLLDRNFTVSAPERVWVADTTYLPVMGAFLFLCVVIDLHSRKVVGWELGDRLNSELSYEALRKALSRRHPPRGLLFHSDRGTEFAAACFRSLLSAAGAIQSMSRRGNCWDNAVAESFFSTLEFEGPHDASWRLVSGARPALFEFIEGYYNARRMHSSNAYRSPNEAESEWHFRALAA